MVKFAANFCYCAVDQEKAVFQWKRAVSGPSALLGLEMVKFAANFCYYAVDREKAVFKRKRAVSSPFAFLGPEMPRKGQNLSRSSARKQPESVWEQPEISQCLGTARKEPEPVWERAQYA